MLLINVPIFTTSCRRMTTWRIQCGIKHPNFCLSKPLKSNLGHLNGHQCVVTMAESRQKRSCMSCSVSMAEQGTMLERTRFESGTFRILISPLVWFDTYEQTSDFEIDCRYRWCQVKEVHFIDCQNVVNSISYCAVTAVNANLVFTRRILFQQTRPWQAV
jgi:hypothetical protein